jgi:tRNA modification GTPase
MSIDNPTIFALSSGRPPAAIAVVRISGSRAGEALKALAGRLPKARRAALVRVRDPQTREPIDEALALWFPGPNSETGEDVAELQLHGGRAVIAATLAALGTLEGLRPAEAGEFTRRAFDNGKLDLTAVEGLADLVAAETEGQRRQALRQLQGALGVRAEGWRARLVRALALAEAVIDFSDEGDVPDNLETPVLEIVRSLQGEIGDTLADGRRGERLRDGLVVAIAGPPNAGKSTLLNRIARREAAIVSPHAGTTRDVIEVHLDLDGWPVTLLDTAGIRDTQDAVEMEGVRRARQRAAAADLVLWVEDASLTANRQAAACAGALDHLRDIDNAKSDHAGREVASLSRSAPTVWVIRNKIDLLATALLRNESCVENRATSESKGYANEDLKNTDNKALMTGDQRNESVAKINEKEFSISSVTGSGFEALMDRLARHAEGFLAGGEPALIARERQRLVLQEALGALQRAVAVASTAGRDELLAEELRIAARALARLIGRVDVEDVLDVIFRDFCIGK